MLKAIALGLSLTMMLVVSCSSSNSGDSGGAFSCDTAKSKCPNDDPLAPAECKRLTEDPKCGSKNLAYFMCIGAHQTCLADGTTDTSVTDRECASEYSAVVQCATSDAGP